MALLEINQNLKGTTHEQKNTYGGMAFFAGTGPVGATCAKCRFWQRARESQKAAKCAEFTRLMSGKTGPTVPSFAMACKYFERRNNG